MEFSGNRLADIDTVTDFDVAGGDVLDIDDIIDYDNQLHDITDYLRILDSGDDSTVEINQDGTGGTYSWTQVALLEGVTGLTDEAALETAGTIITV